MAGMTATAAPTQPAALPAGRLGGRVDFRLYLPALFAVLNGIAFVVVRPDVNDLWAARARASAVEHGVGLTYWFSWFGGGSTPGNYSVVTPYLCAAVGTEVVGAISAVAATALVARLVRGTTYPVAACWAAAVAAGLNLWSGRVPFLLGSAVAIGAIIALRNSNRAGAMVLTLLSILASPVSGAFIAMGLSGTFLTTRTKQFRPIIAWTVGTALVALGLVAVEFGAPGPEPFSTGMFIEVLAAQLVLWFARPPDHLRTTLGATLLATVVLWIVPNGLGVNFGRFVFFCLPVAVLALATQRRRIAVAAVVPALVLGGVGTINDLVDAANPVSSVGYYRSLAAHLDGVADLRNYRVEVVNHGAHAGYDALLDHALLARGWETQEDQALNSPLNEDDLDAVTYKVWLDNNAVGYVALPSSAVGGYPEYTLVQTHRPSYLHRIWSDDDWQLFRVDDPTPIVASPGAVITHDQKSMTISVPCRCTVAVRVRWSKFLTATLQTTGRKPGTTTDAKPAVEARVANDGTGWTRLTTSRAGTYMLRGSLRGGLFSR
jgi:hypothetical protein